MKKSRFLMLFIRTIADTDRINLFAKRIFLPLKWTKTHLSRKASNGLFRVNVRVRLKKVHKHTAGKFFMPTFV